jgi:glycosyltransferase involved in cell wall biosynthesis
MTDSTKTSPRITVVTVVYNGVRAIARTLESTLAQSYPNIELVVVDGGSKDGTQAIVQGYGSRIDTFVSEPDAGVYDAMNKAVALASGEYLLFMNCGDVFAGPNALSAAMRLSSPGTEQLIFGGWIRQESAGRQRSCLPSPSAGLFNHQALVYSRSIHSWHGDYLTVPGWTTADYLFFVTLVDSPKVAWTILTEPIARIDISGISAGLQTFSQKQSIDYLCGRIGRWRLIAMLSLHPAYHRLKRLWRGLR